MVVPCVDRSGLEHRYKVKKGDVAKRPWLEEFYLLWCPSSTEDNIR